MMESIFLNAQQIAKILDVSLSKAYCLIREMNQDMKQKGYLVLPGKINRKYFYDHMYPTQNIQYKE